ncbi:MAG: HAD family phosphatase [Acidobacteriaceae bacterium]|nr:HAD family phosphatase [Acidobacteriaceae bacterium]
MPTTHSASSKLATASAAERIDVVLFDYGQVLSAPADPAAWARIRVITGLDEARLFAAYWEYRHQYDSGALTGPAYWSAVAAHAGITLDEEQRTALFAADIDLWTALNQPMVEWAWRLQSAGIRTGVLSNIGDRIGVGIVARLPWLAAFDHCTWSYSLLLAKPNPEIYRKTAKALDSAPAHILFIDDREENIAAAAALGFQTLHYTTHTAFENEMRRRGLSLLLDAGAIASDSESYAETLAK